MAANANVPRGLQPVRHRNGAPYNGAWNRYYVPATDGTALYVGDPVIVVTAASDTMGVPTVTRATAAGGSYITGVMVGCDSGGDPIITRTQDKPVYREASVATYIMVADDPDLLFEIQENGAMGVGAASRNADLVAGAGSTGSGYSGWMLASSTLQTTATLQLRILRPVPRADNDPTDAGGLAKWLVAINLHSQRNASGV